MNRKLRNTLIAAMVAVIGLIISSAAKAEIKVMVNNEPIAFDSNPVIKNGRTLVPLRAIFERLGASVDWDEGAQTVTAVKDDKTLKLTVGSSAAYINGNKTELDVPAEIVKGRTLVPVRFISESLDCTVSWDDMTRTVKIYERGFVFGSLRVHYLDVGQGDSEFIELPSGKTMLIDAANAEDGKKIGDYIRYLGYSRIDYLVATHPHVDHIGGMEYIVNQFEIGNVYMSDASTSTQTFMKLLTAIDKKNIPTIEAKAGVAIDDDLCEIKFLAPDGGEYDGLNNYSAVLKIVYKNTSFLFMGDAEKEEEDRISGDVSADVIKIGHHGSSSSSGESFIRRVNPKYAVISCGKGNSYGHPHSETVALLNYLNINILRTDELGTIIAESGGENILINKDISPIKENAPPGERAETSELPSASAEPAKADEQTNTVQSADGNTTVYVTKSGKKYHSDGCSSLKKSKIPITLAEAKLEYEPCLKCNAPK